MSKVYTTLPYPVILSALDKLDAYIRPTYGPSGRGILVDANGYQKMLDDGYMAIDEFELDDELENAVIKFVKAASFQANKRAGDGTTTATLLMIAVVRQALTSGATRQQVLEDLEIAAMSARASIHSTIRTIDSLEDLTAIAYNAYRDSQIAGIVAQVAKEVGADGVITVEGGEALETKSDVVVGMSIPSGFYSPYFSNDAGKVEIKDAAILLTTRRITANTELMPVLERLIATGKRQLLIVCDGMDGEALTTLIMNRARGSLDVMVVKTPYSDVAKKDFLTDLAVVTGATVADDAAGIRLEDVAMGALGKASKVITDKEETLIVGGEGDKALLDARADIVRTLLVEQPYNDAIQTRLARLTGGIGVIKVGANTEAEIVTKKAKVEDAVRSTQLAYKTGVVKGGAQAFLVETSSPELTEALKYPRSVLEDNGLEHLSDTAEDAYGVIESAIESAVSIATLLLNCGGVITKKNDNHN